MSAGGRPPAPATNRPPGAVLTPRELNRATLARQSLLDRSRLDPVDAIERFGGLQAQEPASPYIALWSRLAGFEAVALDRAISDRRAVKTGLARGTLHLVSADDYLHFQPALRSMLQRGRVRDQYRDADVDDIEAVAEAALRFADRPRTNAEMHAHLEALAATGGRRGDDVWWRVRGYAPFIRVPDDGPWSFGRRLRYVAARSWLAGRAFADERTAVELLLRRYLGAFGPSTVADLRSWSRETVGRLRPVLEAMPDVVRFRTEAGRELFDLAGAPRPDPDVPAPPRLLPMWDSVLLAHEDRTRILPAEHRRTVIAVNGDVLPTFLVDGVVAGLWWAEADGPAQGGTQRTRIVLEPFGRIGREERRALEAEADALAAFVAPREPAVYARYRTSRARRNAAGRAERPGLS